MSGFGRSIRRRSAAEVKLLSWNIRQGGGPRRHRIAECIRAHDADVVALIEFVPGTGGELTRALRDKGFGHEIQGVRRGFDYTVCVLSKTRLARRDSGIPLLEDSGLWLEVGIPDHDFTLGVVHAPTSPRARMREFLGGVVAVAEARKDDAFLFVGDFNTGAGQIDGPLKNFGDVDRFLAVQAAGFHDAWRHVHGDLVEHTYTFPRTGKSYRIDHALASRSLLGRVRGCGYSHEERTCGASDHSALWVEF